ncbi:hypothetical protein AX16_008270 [Volvariella volvacea WC 439]|nr:hypothetical protein AX16_008270 [Volvariella volvacea WC 439]
MESIIHRLTQRFFPKDKGYTITILGLDTSGKTTLLYLLSTGQVVRTIPTIGFNVETITVKTPTSVLSFNGLDVGGCGASHMRSIIAWYTTVADAIVWMIDSADRERLPESLEEAQIIVKMTMDRKAEAGKPPAPFPILVLANKQDCSNAISVDEIQMRFSTAMPNHVLSVFKTSCTAPYGSSGLPEAFGWLSVALQGVTSKNPGPVLAPSGAGSQVYDPRSSDPLLQRISNWVTLSDSDSSPDEFLSQFHNLHGITIHTSESPMLSLRSMDLKR